MNTEYIDQVVNNDRSSGLAIRGRRYGGGIHCIVGETVDQAFELFDFETDGNDAHAVVETFYTHNPVIIYGIGETLGECLSKMNQRAYHVIQAGLEEWDQLMIAIREEFNTKIKTFDYRMSEDLRMQCDQFAAKMAVSGPPGFWPTNEPSEIQEVESAPTGLPGFWRPGYPRSMGS